MLKQGRWLVLSCTPTGKGGIVWSYCFSSFWCPSVGSENPSWSRGVTPSFQKWNRTNWNRDSAKMVWDTSALGCPCRIWVTAWKELRILFWSFFPVMLLFWIKGLQSWLVLIHAVLSLQTQSVCRHQVKSVLLRWIIVVCRHLSGERAVAGWRPTTKEERP